MQETGRADAVRWATLISSRPDVLYLDTETTGLGNADEIVDIAALDNAGNVLLDTLVKPRRLIPSDAIAIHGISNRMVRHAPEWPEVHALLVDLFANFRHIVVYNAEFDRRLIGQCCAIHALRLPQAHWHCAMKQYAAFIGNRDAPFGDYRWHKLGQAVRHFDLAIVADHRALSDARACRAVVSAIARQ